ncbi:MAG: hypothetical protein ACE5GS_17450 [Kiloniellaceae bacterium]
MMQWDALRLVWEIAVSLAAAGAGGLAWQARRATKAARFAERLSLVEARIGDVPTRDAVHDLAVSIERLSGDIRVILQRLDGMQGHAGRLDRVTERMEQFLLDQARDAQ